MKSIVCDYPSAHPPLLRTFPPTGNAGAAPVLEADNSSLFGGVYRIRSTEIEQINEADRETFSGLNYSDIVEYWVHL